MNIPQTSIQMYLNRGILGMLCFASEVRRQISRVASGYIYYGRAVIQSRLNDAVCRMPRSNKIVITDSAGTFTAGNLVTVITLGYLKNGEIAAESDAAITVTTAYGTSKDASMTAHAAAIKAAISDCYSCAYDASAHTITYIGDCKDVISSATSVAGITGNMTISSEVISSADVAADILGIAYLTNERQQALSTGYTYYVDLESVNILQQGSVWANVEEAVYPSSTLYARLITSSSNYAGYFGKSSDSSKCVTLSGAKFLETIAAAAINPITINLPQ